MVRSVRLFVAVVLPLGFGIGAGMGATAAFGSGPSAATPRAVSDATPAVTTSSPELHYVALAGCTVVDTRKAVGKIGDGVSRDYTARGLGSLAGQGGSATGCGVPANAKVLAVKVGAISPASPGFMKVKAYGPPGAGIGAVNYEAHQDVAGWVNINLSAPGSTKDFTLSNIGGPAHVIVTVTGYYIASMYATINFDGTIAASSRVVSASLDGTGLYLVTFDRDVSRCAFNATFSQTLGGHILAEPSINGPAVVFLLTQNSAGASFNAAFNITATC